MTKLLVIAWGNPSRGDDALGPEFLAAVEAIEPPAGCTVDFVTDFQLQPEHALDLVGYDRVLFVDASLAAGEGAFSFVEIEPAIDATFTTHALSPHAVLATYQRIFDQAPPAASVLAIRGERFELGDPITASGRANLAAAIAFYRTLLQ